MKRGKCFTAAAKLKKTQIWPSIVPGYWSDLECAPSYQAGAGMHSISASRSYQRRTHDCEMLNLFLSMSMGGGLGLLGPVLGAGGFESPPSWNSKVGLGFLGPCGRVNLFPSSTRRSGRLDLPERGTHVKKTNCLAAFSLSSSPTVPLFPFRHWNRS